MRLISTPVLLVAALLAGCGEPPPPPAPIHLIDDPSIRRPGAFVSWGTPVTIAGETRTVLSASAPVMAPVTERVDPATKHATVGARIPDEMRALPWLIFESVVTRGAETTMIRSWPVVGKVAGTYYEVPRNEKRIGPDGTAGIRLWPVPALADRDVETGEMDVLPNATLVLAVGIEPASWDPSIIPIDMTVAAVADGQETVLHTIQLNVRRPEHRRWVDAFVPLDAVAGRRVRLRLRARATIDTIPAPTLPVWADPIVVGARAVAARDAS